MMDSTYFQHPRADQPPAEDAHPEEPEQTAPVEAPQEPVVDAEAVAEPEVAPEAQGEPVHPVRVWLEHHAHFGVMPEIVAGAAALAGKAELTLREMEVAVETYLAREV